MIKLIVVCLIVFIETANAFFWFNGNFKRPEISVDIPYRRVNVLGFNAGTGFRANINKERVEPEIYAEAGTPFGQNAEALLGGSIDRRGTVGGRAYAGAQLTDDHYAEAEANASIDRYGRVRTGTYAHASKRLKCIFDKRFCN